MSDATMLGLIAEAQPWFTNYGLAGALLGGGIGMLGAFFGCAFGVLGPRGRARALVVGTNWVGLVAGVALLAAGVTALAGGQPYGVWYPLLLSGGLLGLLMGTMVPVVRLVYRQAEHRRLEAEEFRRG